MLNETVVIPDSALDIALHEACQIPLDEPLTTEALATLVELNLSSSEIRSLEGMQYCFNLSSLDVSGNYLTDLTPVLGLLSLTTLNIGSNFYLSDDAIQKISALIYMEELYVDYCLVASLDFAKAMPGLKKLSDNHSSSLLDVKGLENLGVLSTLFLYEATGLTDITPLSTLSSLSYLDLSRSYNIHDFSPVNQIRSLRRLDINSAKIENINFLNNLPAIEMINFSDNKITDLSPLINSPTLNNVAVQQNLINDLTPLNNLKNLTTLYLEQNCITSASVLNNLPLLNICNLQNNFLTDINEIVDLPAKLDTFLYDHNFLSGYPGQKALDLSSTTSLHVGETVNVEYIVCYTADGANYVTWKDRISTGVEGYSVISNEQGVLSATGEGVFDRTTETTSVHATLIGVSEGISTVSVQFSYSGSTPVQLPFTNGEYQTSVTVVAA